MAQDLWQAHYQIIVNNLSEGIHKITKYAAVFLNTQTLKMI